MSNQWTQLKRANRKGNIRRITINEVNLATSYISGTDKYGNTFRVTFTFQNPGIISIPDIGETWTIEQYQQEWYLKEKQLSDYSIISDLNPGTKLIDGTNLIINPTTLMIPNLPTADPHVNGQIWNNSGILKVSAG